MYFDVFTIYMIAIHKTEVHSVLRERDHLGDPDLAERTILRWIFRKWDVGVWTVSSWFRTGAGGGQL